MCLTPIFQNFTTGWGCNARGYGGGGFVCERVIIITWGEIMRDGGANPYIASANQLFNSDNLKVNIIHIIGLYAAY
jgi:hypothetical protein